MGPRQTMSVGAVLCTAVAMSSVFFLVVSSAPTSSKSSADDVIRTIAGLTSQEDLTREKPLTRTKRAEEILFFGNHQNAPRVKKSDPAAATALETSPTEGQVKAAGDAAAAAVKTDDNALPAEANDGGVDDEAEEHPFPVENQDEGQEEGGDDQNGFEGIPMESEETDFPRYEGQEQQQQPQQQEPIRRKRNARTAAAAALMTAENMVAGGSVASVASRPIRAKRDLDYEELRELFENSRETSPYEAEAEAEEYEDEDGDFRPVAVVPVLPEEDRQNDEEEEEEAEEEMSKRDEGPLAVAIPYDYEPRYDDAASEKVELIRELVKQKAEEDAKEKLIDYLLAAAIASSSEAEDGGEDGGVDDGRLVVEEAPVRPDYDDDGEDDDDDRREVIVPVAAAKRNVFYPYSYEPYGGRWGAMVPGAKRSADEYERLYRLAEALNADDNDYEEK